MARPNLNLLFTLDVLLAEGSVARAARRLRLSPSAMSRALARLREATGDPLLVRAGRGLVPSPRALELRERVSQLVHDAEAALRPADELNLAKARSNVHAADQRRLCGKLRGHAPGSHLRRGPRRSTALPAQARQGQCAAARWNRRPGNRRGGQDDRPGSACAGVVSRPLHWRRANRASAEQGRNHPRPLCRRQARLRLAARSSTRGLSTTPWRRSDWNARLPRSSAVSRQRWLWLEPPIWSPAFPNDTPASCAPECIASHFRCRFRRSRFHCSGIRGWMAIRRIAGFASASRTPVPAPRLLVRRR